VLDRSENLVLRIPRQLLTEEVRKKEVYTKTIAVPLDGVESHHQVFPRTSTLAT